MSHSDERPPTSSSRDEQGSSGSLLSRLLGLAGHLAVGARLGPYRVLREVGRGGMGVVYEAEDTRSGSRVALKLIAERFAGDAAAAARFEREISIASRLHHVGIAAQLDAGTCDGRAYYAMEFVDGLSLERVLALHTRDGSADWSRLHLRALLGVSTSAGGAMRVTVEANGGDAHAAANSAERWSGALEIAIQVAEALEHAHRLGVVHRDLKPANILLDAVGRPVLTDFGLARDLARSPLTETGAIVGTLLYAAPEQLTDKLGPVDHRADVYGLGATLYEMLTLHRPFEQPQLGPASARWRAPRVTDPREHDPTLPAPLARVVLRALEHDPVLRHATAGALADDLRSVQRGGAEVAPAPPLRARIANRFRRRPVSSTLAALSTLVLPVIALLVFQLAQARPVLARARRAEDLGLAYSYVLGLRNPENDRPAEARRIFDRLWLEEPGDPEVAAGICISLARANRHAELLDWLAGHEARDRTSMDALAPLRADALRALGRVAEADGIEVASRNVRGATADFVRAQRLLGARAPTAEQRAEATALLYGAAFEGKRPFYYFSLAKSVWSFAPEDTLRQISRAIETEWGDTAEGLFYGGMALGRCDPDAALRMFERARRLAPRSGVVRYNIGVVLVESGRLDEAIAAYREAIELDPRDARALTNLCGQLENRENARDLAEAIELGERAVRVDDAYAFARQNLGAALYRAWKLARAQRDAAPAEWRERAMLERAVVHFERGLELDPDARFTWNSLGLALRGLGSMDLQRTRRAFERAIECDPDYMYAHENLIEFLSLDCGDLEAGLEAACRAVLHVRTSSWLWYQLAALALEARDAPCDQRATLALDASTRALQASARRDVTLVDALSQAYQTDHQPVPALSLANEALELLSREPRAAFLRDRDFWNVSPDGKGDNNVCARIEALRAAIAGPR